MMPRDDQFRWFVILLLGGVMMVVLRACPAMVKAQSGLRSAGFVALLNPSGAPAAPATYLLEENFEAAGYDVAGWFETLGGGTVDEDFSTSGLALQGSQCLKIDGGGTYTYTQWTNTSDELYGYFQVYIQDGGTNSGNELFTFSVAGVSDQFWIRADTVQGWNISHGAANSPNVLAGTNGATYHVWWHYRATVGANDGAGELWVNTTSTKPGTVSCTVTNLGSGTAAANIISPRARDLEKFRFDRVLLDDVPIGSAP